MGPIFTILVVALAFFTIVAMMVVVMREKVDHEAHTRYVRSPWTDDAVETQNKVDAHLQQSDEAREDTIPVSEPEASTGAVDSEAAAEDAEENVTT